MKKISTIILIMSVLIISCQQNGIKIEKDINRTPSIFPDYKDVTIPYNIAPLNFRVEEEGDELHVTVTGKGQKTELNFRDNKVLFREKKWSRLLKNNSGNDLEISLRVRHKDTMKVYRPFRIHVSGEQADDYLVYRLIMPGFQNWNQMGIYQRSLESFKEETVIDSRVLPGTCMNCHSFAMNDPENMVFHLRESYGGTILYRNGLLEKLNTKAGKMFGNAAFPAWHPSGNYIAFSINRMNQIFHATGPHRAAAIDMQSDMFVYDIERNEMLTSPVLSSGENFETFPCFSPDGSTLYYCSAQAVKMPEKFNTIKYSLCSVSFDQMTGRLGEKADTLVSGRELNKSISIPRISPDGRFLMFNVSDYGCFPAYNPEADLWLFDLESGDYRPLEILNSDNVDSWHSWSLNSRWTAFSSRRDDGLYSNIYLAFIDEKGTAHKPFILPQKDPSFYDTFLFSFNVPEFIKSGIRTDIYEIEKVAKKTPAVQVMSESGH